MSVLYFPTEEADIPSLIGSVLAGGAFFAGQNQPAWVPDSRWIGLPFIYESDFEDSLKRAVVGHEVSAIISRHPASIVKLAQIDGLQALGVEILAQHPQLVIDAAATSAVKIQHEVHDLFGLGMDRDPLSIVALGQVLDGVVGATSTSKAWVLHLLAERPQAGLVVEVGVMFGKSALALALGASKSGARFVGVDTWENDAAVQVDSPKLLEATAHSWNRRHMQGIAEQLVALTGCQSTMVKGDSGLALNQLKASSGGTYPSVSLIHIDANHDYAKVKMDWELWEPRLTPGHVVVFDDTAWAAGDGPRRLVDSIVGSGRYGKVVDFQGSTFMFD
jgi:predicted O-methyltransferase YrrM